MMAIVIPTAETPTNALCRKTLTRLSVLAKPGVVSPAINQMTTVTTAIPKRSQRRSQSSWLIVLPVAGASGIVGWSVCRMLKAGLSGGGELLGSPVSERLESDSAEQE